MTTWRMRDKDSYILERLPGDLRAIADMIGLENTLKLEKRFRGTYVYIPSLDDLRREVRNKEIRDAYDKGGVTARDLAIRFGLSQRQIFNILGIQPQDQEQDTLPLL